MKLHAKVHENNGWVGDYIRIFQTGKDDRVSVYVYGDKDFTLDEAHETLEAYGFDLEELDFHDNIETEVGNFTQAYVFNEFKVY